MKKFINKHVMVIGIAIDTILLFAMFYVMTVVGFSL
tara:strand:+ start:496 stop:603 length:108 start_codon:yes stop_codon:yes gene_type:complete